MKWITEGFENFLEGTFENGGQNLYVSRKGVLQRIFQYDLNQDGHPDILFACSQSMNERPPIYVYMDPLHDSDALKLPTNGTYAGCLADLHGNGFLDLVVACQNDGQHNDIASVLYFGSEEGWTEKYKMELPAPNATDAVTGDFNGDGKQEIIFICNGKLRMFFQKEQGFGPADFVDYDVAAAKLAVADLDGDGICDLVVKDREGGVYVLFGSKTGLDTKQIRMIQEGCGETNKEFGGSTEGNLPSSTAWRPGVIHFEGTQYVFCVQEESVVLYTCDPQREFAAAKRLACPGAVGATAVDLNEDGYEELAVAVFADRDEEADCRIYIGSEEGINEECYETISVKGAVGVIAANLEGKKLVFCRAGEHEIKEVPCPIVGLDAENKPQIIRYLMGGNCSAIAAGRSQGGVGDDSIVMFNHMLNTSEGHENVYVYLGNGKDYEPDQKVCFPAYSAVDGAMVDFRDTGKVDVLVVNCFEDAPYRDHGSYIYLNDGDNHFDPDNKMVIPSLHGHGEAMGDFRKSGYLDIAVGGFMNREIRIFHGSENGYSLEDSTRIILGPGEEEYAPPRFNSFADIGIDEEERKLTREFGEVRWIFACDFNQDGWLDLFVSQIVGPRCFILWGGPEGFSKERMTVLHTDGVASANVADLNGNGYPDLILGQHMSTKKVNVYESYVTVYWGGPEGYRENRKMQLPVNCANSVTVGDYSGKGKLDIYATAYRNGRCRDILSHLYENDGQGNFSVNRVKYLFNHSGSGCVSGDFNGDGYTDLAVACHKEYGNHESHSFIFWGGPEGLSDERKTVLPTTGPHGMCTVDPGNILDRGPKERYTSKCFVLPVGAKVDCITWEGECTSTSWVELEIRAAENEMALECAPWQFVESGQDISHLQLSGVVQYRLALCASCSCGTPRITRVEVSYSE